MKLGPQRTIDLVPNDGIQRPFWSVMIPTFNPDEAYLEQTLRSILNQDPGPDQMQIIVVDDCSPKGAPVELIRRVAGDRITLISESKNLGLAGIWNRCIDLACGEWVHILHQDDLILPGFYERLKLGAQSNPEIGAAFCRQAFMDEDGHWFHITQLERRQRGVLENWMERIAIRQRIETASIVVRRSVYEKLGGFTDNLCYALDWEMWRRIASRYQVWYEPQILACYRLHSKSTTMRLGKEGKRIEDVVRSIEVAKAYLPTASADRISLLARREFALTELDEVMKFKDVTDFSAGRSLILECIKVSRDYAVIRKGFKMYWLLLKEQIKCVI